LGKNIYVPMKNESLLIKELLYSSLPLINTNPSVMKMWPDKRSVLSSDGQFSSTVEPV